MTNELKEYQQRREWLKEAARMVEADEMQPVVIEHTLMRFMRTPVKAAVVYSDTDTSSGYSDTGEYENQVRRERTGYFADIAALEAAIERRRAGEKVGALLEAINELKSREAKRDEQIQRLLADKAATAGERHTPGNNSYIGEYPKELDTDLARYVFGRFVEDGTLSKDGDYYKWEREKSHFAVFVAVACNLLGLIRYEDDRLKWKPFAIAFKIPNEDVERARETISKMKNSGKNPLKLKYRQAGGYIPYNFNKYVDEWKRAQLNSGQP